MRPAFDPGSTPVAVEVGDLGVEHQEQVAAIQSFRGGCRRFSQWVVLIAAVKPERGTRQSGEAFSISFGRLGWRRHFTDANPGRDGVPPASTFASLL